VIRTLSIGFGDRVRSQANIPVFERFGASHRCLEPTASALSLMI